MGKLRQNIPVQFYGAVHDAKEWFDWKRVIARHPIASLGVAAAIGFALIPRRASPKLPSATATNGHLKHHETLSATLGTAKGSLAASLIRSALSAGLSIALNRLLWSLAQPSQKSTHPHATFEQRKKYIRQTRKE